MIFDEEAFLNTIEEIVFNSVNDPDFLAYIEATSQIFVTDNSSVVSATYPSIYIFLNTSKINTASIDSYNGEKFTDVSLSMDIESKDTQKLKGEIVNRRIGLRIKEKLMESRIFCSNDVPLPDMTSTSARKRLTFTVLYNNVLNAIQ